MIEAVASMVREADFETYRTDIKLRLAVERCVEIVSEASRHVPEAQRARFPDVPWPEIAAIGNRLRHEYSRIDDAILWRVATEALPALAPIVAALLTEVGDP